MQDHVAVRWQPSPVVCRVERERVERMATAMTESAKDQTQSDEAQAAAAQREREQADKDKEAKAAEPKPPTTFTTMNDRAKQI